MRLTILLRVFFLVSLFSISQNNLDWNYISTDDYNAVNFPISISYEQNGQTSEIPISALLGVFYLNSEDQYECAGYSSYSEGITTVNVFGDDLDTEEIDGFIEGGQFYYFLRIEEGGSYSDYIALDTDVIYYPSFPPLPPFDNDTWASGGQTTYISDIHFIPFFSSEEPLIGCMNQSSCTYEPNATIHDSELCLFPQEIWFVDYLDCDGNCYLDSDDDGICNVNEIIGCMDPQADNYQPYYTDEGDCWYLGCMNPTAINYDPSATHPDPSACLFDEFVLDWTYSFSPESQTLAISYNITGLDYEGEITVGGFYLNDNNLYNCGGSTIVPNDPQPYSVLSLFPDDSTTPGKDGFSQGEEIIFIILYDGVEYIANPVFSNQPGFVTDNTFQSNGYGLVTELQVLNPVLFGCTNTDYFEYNP